MVALENLPLVLFHKEALYEVGHLLGKPIKVDGYTANQSKLNQSNICIEMDISKPLPSHIWIKLLDKGTAIKVRYGKVPHYCMFCHKLGHKEIVCLAKEKAPSVSVAVPTIPKQNPATLASLTCQNPWQDSSGKIDRQFANRGGRALLPFRGRNGRGRGNYHFVPTERDTHYFLV